MSHHLEVVGSGWNLSGSPLLSFRLPPDAPMEDLGGHLSGGQAPRMGGALQEEVQREGGLHTDDGMHGRHVKRMICTTVNKIT